MTTATRSAERLDHGQREGLQPGGVVRQAPRGQQGGVRVDADAQRAAGGDGGREALPEGCPGAGAHASPPTSTGPAGARRAARPGTAAVRAQPRGDAVPQLPQQAGPAEDQAGVDAGEVGVREHLVGASTLSIPPVATITRSDGSSAAAARTIAELSAKRSGR